MKTIFSSRKLTTAPFLLALVFLLNGCTPQTRDVRNLIPQGILPPEVTDLITDNTGVLRELLEQYPGLPQPSELIAEITNEAPPVSSSFYTTFEQAPELDNFYYPYRAYQPLNALPKGEAGQYVLAPGVYYLNTESFGLKAGGHPPYLHNRLLPAPLEGGKSATISKILNRYGDNPAVTEDEVQTLLWAVVSGAGYDDMAPDVQATANALLTPEDINEFRGGIVPLIPDPVWDFVADELDEQFANDPLLRAFYEADNEVRGLISQADTTLGDIEDAAIWAGVSPDSHTIADVPAGRWSQHPDGFYMRYVLNPESYRELRQEVYVPPEFSGQSIEYNPSGTVAAPNSTCVPVIGIGSPLSGDADDDSKKDNGCSASEGAAVNLFTGEEKTVEIDLALPGSMPLTILRTYRNHSGYNGFYGFGWDLNVNQRLQLRADGSALIRNGQGGVYLFEAQDGAFIAPAGMDARLERTVEGYSLASATGLRHSFDTLGRLAVAEDRFGNQIRFTYAATPAQIVGTLPTGERGVVGEDYLLERVTDASGREIAFTYNAENKLSSVRYADQEITYSYDGVGNLVEVTDELGASTQYRYEDPANPYYLTSQLDDAGNVTVSRAYDGLGNVVEETTGQVTQSFSYQQSLEGYSSQTTVTTGSRLTVYTFDEQGSTTSITENGVSTNLAYTPENRVSTINLSVDGAVAKSIAYRYDDSGNFRSLETGDGVRIDASFNAEALPTSYTNSFGGTYAFGFGDGNKLARATTPLGDDYAFSTNARGQLTSATDPLGRRSELAYDAQGNLTSATDPQGLTTRFSYTALGDLAAVTDPTGLTSNFAHDALGRVTQFTEAADTVHAFAYDEGGNLTAYSDPAGGRVQFAYTPENYLAEETDTLGNVTRYSYDELGNLTQTSKPNGSLLSYTYNELDLPTGASYSDGTQVRYGYSAFGDLLEASNSNLTLSYTYGDGAMTPPTQVRHTSAFGETSLIYDYLDEDRRTGAVHGLTLQNDGTPTLAVAYDYDTMGNLTRVQTSGMAQANYQYSYDAAGRLSQISAVGSGVSTTLEHNESDRVIGLTNEAQGATLPSYRYTHDAVGNVLSKTETTTGKTTRYAYDALHRLTGATLPDGTEHAYTYDTRGNRTTFRRGAETISYTYNAANQLVSSTADGGTTYTYDANGNLIFKATIAAETTYTWNSEDELIQVSLSDSGTISYTYDPLGRRHSKTDAQGNTIYYVYDGLDLIQELDEQGQVLAIYTYGIGIDHPISMTRDGETYLYVYDALGSVTGLTDSRGELAASYEYDPWGTPLESSNSELENPFRFTGREWDSDVGLYYYRTRYYDATLGRFIQRDKIGINGGLNSYRYVGNNPINITDPTGELAFLVPIVWAGVEIGLAIYDTYDTFDTLTDPCASDLDKAFSVGGLLIGAIAPGGGYGKGAKELERKIDGVSWPPNRGFAEEPSRATLVPGGLVDRYGSPQGTFVSPDTTPFPMRSLPSSSYQKPLNTYEILRPIEVDAGTVAPWFDQPGGGVQFELPRSVQELIDEGYLKQVF